MGAWRKLGRKIRLLLRKLREERGITGLETAIILIAFVVVASVFAYTVLSAGIFSSERGKETIHAGLKEARGSLELKGGVIAFGPLVVSDCDTAWTTDEANITVTTDNLDKKEGEASVKITIGSDISATTVLAYQNLAVPLDLSREKRLQLWIKSSADISDGALQLILKDEGGTQGTFNLGSLTANTWTFIDTLDLTAMTDRDGVNYVGLQFYTDGTVTLSANTVIHLDIIETPEVVREAKFIVTNAVNGEPVDLTETTDSDKDGLLSDEDTKNHVTVISYADKNQRVADIAWTVNFLGDNDGDNLLEANEKAEITVYLNALYGDNYNSALKTNTEFTIEVKPPKGSVLVIKKTTPAKLDPVMILN